MEKYQNIKDNDLMSVDGGILITSGTALGIGVGASVGTWVFYNLFKKLKN